MNTKTAISIPRDIFRMSEKLSKRLKISRSAVFALGVERLSQDFEEAELIERINAICSEVETSVPTEMKKYQADRIKRTK